MSAGVYTVYILASGLYGMLYIGVTNNLRTRLELHRAGRGSEFVKKYAVHHLVHVEEFASPQEAIQREKQLKNWQRDWKIQLIEKDNQVGAICPTCFEARGYGSLRFHDWCRGRTSRGNAELTFACAHWPGRRAL